MTTNLSSRAAALPLLLLAKAAAQLPMPMPYQPYYQPTPQGVFQPFQPNPQSQMTVPGGGLNPMLPPPSAPSWQQMRSMQQQQGQDTEWFRIDHPFARPQQTPGQGFPEFPPNLQWGGYPAPSGLREPPKLAAGAAPPPLLPEPPDWPSWVKVKARYELPYDANQAVLVRLGERVWYRTPDEEAYLPLYHFDKIRPLPQGSEIQVRQMGNFLLLLHEGTRVYAQGLIDLKLTELSDAVLRLQASSFTTLQLLCRARPCELTLPDGSVVMVPGGKQEEGPVYLQLQRDEARGSMFNAGMRPIVWRTPFGDEQIAPGRRVQMLMVPPDPPIAQGLNQRGVEVEERDGRLLCKGGTDGQVVWSGARIAVPQGSTLSIDPLQGKPFSKPAVAPAAPDQQPGGK